MYIVPTYVAYLIISIVLTVLLLSVTSIDAGSLAVGPDYRRPATAVPDAYKAAPLGAWKEGQPLDHVTKGA